MLSTYKWSILYFIFDTFEDGESDEERDELMWGAAWLYKATNNEYYLNYLGNNGDAVGGTGWAMTEFGWDVKYVGVQTLIAKFLMAVKAGNHASVFEKYQEKAEFFMC